MNHCLTGQLFLGKTEIQFQNSKNFTENKFLPVSRSSRIDSVKSVLLKETIVEKVGLESGGIVFDRSTFFADNGHHLLNIISVPQHTTDKINLLHLYDTLVFAPGFQRIDGRVATGVTTGATESVEGADDLECSLGYRFLEVSAVRTDCVPDRQRTYRAVLKLDGSCPLVEGGNSALQICRKRFFSRNLF